MSLYNSFAKSRFSMGAQLLNSNLPSPSNLTECLPLTAKAQSPFTWRVFLTLTYTIGQLSITLGLMRPVVGQMLTLMNTITNTNKLGKGAERAHLWI